MAWIIWLAAFVILIGIEAATMALTTIWFAGGAIIDVYKRQSWGSRLRTRRFFNSLKLNGTSGQIQLFPAIVLLNMRHRTLITVPAIKPQRLKKAVSKRSITLMNFKAYPSSCLLYTSQKTIPHLMKRIFLLEMTDRDWMGLAGWRTEHISSA